jgi:sarcosine oxidase/L-pipecolate oxidase
MIKENHGTIVVGGGIMGISAAYHLAMRGKPVTVLESGDIPNIRGASGDHLRVFRLTYGADAFYTDMALKTLPLWLDLNAQTGERILQQNGMMEFAAKTHGYEEQSFKTLKELKIPVKKLEKDEVKRNYPMINTRALKYAVFHQDGGMIWASKAVGALAGLAQRKGAKVRPQTKIVAVLRDKKAGITGLKDASGKTWTADNYLFAAGPGNVEILKAYKLPIKITKQFQMYVRPPANRGRYRPEHFPVFAALSEGFYGFPLHLHGFLKIADHKKGSPLKPAEALARAEDNPAFERKCRAFLKRYIPELEKFTEFEAHACFYDNTKDDDFIIDRLPDAANGWLAAGFSGHAMKFGPLIGKTLAELIAGGKPELNLHRFRLSRFKGR